VDAAEWALDTQLAKRPGPADSVEPSQCSACRPKAAERGLGSTRGAPKKDYVDAAEWTFDAQLAKEAAGAR